MSAPARPIDARTLKNLADVHPDLVRVVHAAYAASRIPFVVIQGLRTVAEERVNVATGHSQTMHSRHLPDAHGFACAVDVLAKPDGSASWRPLDYQPIAAAMLDAGHALGVPVEWGGDWTTLKDWGHFQLPWLEYPANGVRPPPHPDAAPLQVAAAHPQSPPAPGRVATLAAPGQTERS